MSARSGTLPPILSFTAPEVVPGEILSGDTTEGVLLTGSLDGLDLSSTTLLECELDGVTLSDARLTGARIVETLVTAPFATKLVAGRTTWRDVRVTNPRWGLAEIYDSELTSVHIVGGKIDYLNLRDSRLTSVLLEGCQIGELDLRMTRMERVAVRDCRVGTIELDRSRSRSVDIRGSEFEVVNGIEGLRGVTIDDGQLAAFAPLFAQHLGIVVE